MLALLSILLSSVICTMSQNDYTFYPGVGYYKYHSEEANWYDAWLTCYNEVANLVVINSAAERDVVKALIRENNYQDYFYLAGYHQLFDVNGSVFVTVHGERLDTLPYMQWGPARPDNYLGKQYCGSFNRDALMDDDNCDILRPFICEIS